MKATIPTPTPAEMHAFIVRKLTFDCARDLYTKCLFEAQYASRKVGDACEEGEDTTAADARLEASAAPLLAAKQALDALEPVSHDDMPGGRRTLFGPDPLAEAKATDPEGWAWFDAIWQRAHRTAYYAEGPGTMTPAYSRALLAAVRGAAA